MTWACNFTKTWTPSQVLFKAFSTYFQEQLWTAAFEFLLKGISEHPVISFITFPYIKTMIKKHIPVNRVETDLLQNVHGQKNKLL